MNRQELSAASSIGLLYLIRMLGLFMVLPVLPLLAPQIDSATPLLIGLAIGVYGLSQGLLQIPMGLLSDRIGRKPVIAGGLALFILGSLVAAQADDIYGMIVGRFLQGCGAIASTLMALMSDLTRVDQRSKSMAIIGIAIAGSFGLSLVLGPIIGNEYGLAGIFNLTAILGIVGLCFLLVVIPSPQVRSTNLDSTVQRGRLQTVLRDLGLWRLNISVMFLHYLLVSAFSVFPVLFEGTGQIPVDKHSLYYLGTLLTSFILMLPFMWLADRISDIRPMLVVMVSLFLGALVLMRWSGAYYPVLAAMVLFFMAFNLLEVVLPAQVSKLAAAGSRGTSMGVYTTCQFFGIFLGGIVSGWILSVGGITDLVYTNMAIVMVWLIISGTFPKIAQMGSRTIQLGNLDALSAKQRAETLLSVHGVIDAVIIEADQVAYLKVDEQIIDDQQLKQVVESTQR